MSLVDESVIQSIPKSSGKTRHTNSPVHIKGVGDEMYLSKESLVLDVFFPDVTNTRLAKITREFHIVQDMDCGLLIGNDIIEPEGIVIDLAKKRMQISACDNMACRLKVRRKRQMNRVIIRCAKETLLRGCSYRDSGDSYPRSYGDNIPIRFPTLKLDEYKFNEYPLPTTGCKYSFDPVIRKDMKELYMFNFGYYDVTIPKDHKLGYIELPETPQYTPVKPVDVVQCHFRKAVDLRSSTVTNEAASVKATSPRQVTKKTSSALERAPAVSPKSVQHPPPSLRTFVPFSPVYSRFPLRRSPFFFYRPQFFVSSFPPPSTTYQGNNDPLGFNLYLPWRRKPPSFPPKPGWQ
jgi:hypothetical protein